MRLTWTVLALSLIAATVSVAQETKAPSWSYEGEGGPEQWGNLKPEYSTCKSGQRQSPINIERAKKTTLPAIQLQYKPSALKIIDNGHSVQVNYEPGSFILVGDKRYELRQFHFHHPSEEQIKGRSYDLVAHLVHADAEGHLAVVAVLFQAKSANPAIEALWRNLPSEKNKELAPPGQAVNAADLLPKDAGYYTFDGSLTTPPCTESVTWFVLKAPVNISSEQVAVFTKIYPHNARPVQPVNGRTIAETK